jgi:hypothetical protein
VVKTTSRQEKTRELENDRTMVQKNHCSNPVFSYFFFVKFFPPFHHLNSKGKKRRSLQVFFVSAEANRKDPMKIDGRSWVGFVLTYILATMQELRHATSHCMSFCRFSASTKSHSTGLSYCRYAACASDTGCTLLSPSDGLSSDTSAQ